MLEITTVPPLSRPGDETLDAWGDNPGWLSLLRAGILVDAGALEQCRQRLEACLLASPHDQTIRQQLAPINALARHMQADGRVYPAYEPRATGRQYAREPAIQSLPKHLRHLLVAPEGRVLVAADYSQIELRILAHLSQDPALVEPLRRGADIHAATAAELFEVSSVTEAQRRIGKETNFGVIYGLTAYGLAKRTGLGRKEAQRFIDRFFDRLPGVRAWIDAVQADATANGSVTTLLGRRIRVERAKDAISYLVQGSAADVLGCAMAALADYRLVAQIHDELLIEVDADRIAEDSAAIRSAMANAMPLGVPLDVDIGVGQSWGEASGAPTAPKPQGGGKVVKFTPKPPPPHHRPPPSLPEPADPVLRDFLEHLPIKPYCGDRKWAVVVRTKPHAVRMAYIQFDPPHLRRWLIVDIDIPIDDVERYVRERGLRMPNLVVRNPGNGHVHLYWRLAAPVPTSDKARTKPIRMLAAINAAFVEILGADPNYHGPVAKNPLHGAWETQVLEFQPATFKELAECVPDFLKYYRARCPVNAPDPAGTPADVADAKDKSRACLMFERARVELYPEVLAYRQADDYTGWLGHCKAVAMKHRDIILAQYPRDTPLYPAEARSAAKSIAKWAWENYRTGAGGKSVRQSIRGRFGGRASGKTRRRQSQARAERAAELSARGLGIPEIARDIGCTERTVRDLLRKAGKKEKE